MRWGGNGWGGKCGKKLQKQVAFDKTTCFCWSEMGDSNSRPDGPKPMSEPSGRTESHSLALSVAPTVPLWNFFALFASGTAFAFWDLCGIEFCILKVLPTGFTFNSRYFLPQRAAQKLRRINKEISAMTKKQQADLDDSQPAEEEEVKNGKTKDGVAALQKLREKYHV